jgi:hypothetical protein
MTETETGTKTIALTLNCDHFILDGDGEDKRQYDIRVSNSPFKVAAMDAYGMMCLVSFVGRWSVVDDPDYQKSIRGEIESRVPKATEEQFSEQYALLGKELDWFHRIAVGDWDEMNDKIEADKELRSRFNAFSTRWWKVVCDVVLIKVQKRTYDAWIADKREMIDDFLEDGVQKDKINDAYYNASYKNYAQSYEMISTLAKFQMKMITCWGEECLELAKKGEIDPKKKNWGINHFSALKSCVIWDKENVLTFVAKTNLNTIITDKLFPKELGDTSFKKVEKTFKSN